MAYIVGKQRRPSASDILRIAVPVLLLLILYALPLYSGSETYITPPSRAYRLEQLGPKAHQQQQQQQQLIGADADEQAGTAAAKAAGLPRSDWEQYFPQAQRCQGQWLRDYATLQAAILKGDREPKHLVSIPPHSGLADRLIGFVTHFWHAVLTDRAWTTANHPENPGLDAVCETSTFDWTKAPQAVTDEAILDRMRKDFKGPGARSHVPKGYEQSDYSLQYLFNKRPATIRIYGSENLTSNTAPYLVMLMNRGRTYRLANNPHHKHQLSQLGVPARDMFMCGFFAMCRPVPAIQQYYQKFWDVLSEPGILRIGIQVRTGDKSMWATASASDPRKVVNWQSKFFKCAERLEAAFAAPGQKVVWFLNSDSKQLRQAAKAVYGSKVLTDDDLQMIHPECERRPPAHKAASSSSSIGSSNISSSSSSSSAHSKGCELESRAWALQHSLGSVLTFSLTDFQIITVRSGFGRAGAWLADRRDGIYELNTLEDCVPHKPTPLNVSSDVWSGI